jgi:uncharacterized membrane protein
MSRTRARTRDLARTGTRIRAAARTSAVERPSAEDVPVTGVDGLSGFLARATPWILTISGIVGTAAAFALILDRIALLKDPAFVPSCTISPLLPCGSVMTSPQAEVFGFPNALIGLVAFPIVTTVGVVALAGGSIPRWVWLGLQVGTVGGLVFVHWLIGQSLYAIGTLCPYCMIVWIVTITVFCYTTLHTPDGGPPSRPLPLAATRDAAGDLSRRPRDVLAGGDRRADRRPVLALLDGARSMIDGRLDVGTRPGDEGRPCPSCAGNGIRCCARWDANEVGRQVSVPRQMVTTMARNALGRRRSAPG